jgi:hypothetical protein
VHHPDFSVDARVGDSVFYEAGPVVAVLDHFFLDAAVVDHEMIEVEFTRRSGSDLREVQDVLSDTFKVPTDHRTFVCRFVVPDARDTKYINLFFDKAMAQFFRESECVRKRDALQAPRLYCRNVLGELRMECRLAGPVERYTFKPIVETLVHRFFKNVERQLADELLLATL